MNGSGSTALVFPSPTSIHGRRRGISSSRGKIRCSAFEGNVLLSAAAKRGPLDGVLRLFFSLRNRDTVTWNTAISSCLRHGRPRTALQLFVEMLVTAKHPPDSITIKKALSACGDMGAIALAGQIHAFVIKLGGFPDEDLKKIYTSLVGLYWDWGKTTVARQLFDRIPQRDVVAFTAMMTSCSRAGKYEEAAEIFSEMVSGDCGLILNEYAISAALHVSANLVDEFLGRQVHARAIKSSLKRDFVVGTALIDLYAKCGDMVSANSAFRGVSEPTTASWNAFLDGFSPGGDEILSSFFRMRLTKARPDHTTFAILLRACKGSDIRIIQQLHGLIFKESMGIMDSFISTALFQNYLACGCFHEARKLFDEIPEKDSADFSLGISEYSQRGRLEEAVDLLLKSLEAMNGLHGGAITPLVSATRDLTMGKQLHGLATKFGLGAETNELLGSSLMSMYMKFSCTEEAIQIFNAIGSPDLVSWTSLISGLSDNGMSREGLGLYFKRVLEESHCYPNEYVFSCLLRACADVIAVEEGRQLHAQIIKYRSSKLDPHVLTSLLDMYAKCGYISEAREIFKSIIDPDLALWNALIHGMARHGFPNEAMDLFHELLSRKELKPNHVTYLGILLACSHGGLVDEGYRWFRSIDAPSVDHYSCMVNMMARAGQLKGAMSLIMEMPFEPNEHIWASLLAASCIHQDTELGQYSAERLLELNPKDPGAYVALSNVYAATNQWMEVKILRKMMRKQGIRKEPGLSWLRLNKEVHAFVAGEEDGRNNDQFLSPEIC